MTLSRTVYARLSNYAGLTNLVGTRIYPVKRPSTSAFPAVTYHRIFTGRESAMRADTGDAMARFQFSVWGPQYDSTTAGGVTQVAEQVVDAMQRWSSSTGSVTVQESLIESQTELPWDEETELHHIAVDALVWFKE